MTTDMEDVMSMYPETGACNGEQVLAMAYVPMQHLHTVYEPEDGFVIGTIFPELNKPWLPGGNCK